MPDTMVPSVTDVVELTRALVRCESVTPREAGALQLLEGTLVPLGFRCERMDFSLDELRNAKIPAPPETDVAGYLKNAMR